MKFQIGKGTYIFMNCFFYAAKNLSIGKNSVLNAGCKIDTRAVVLIKDNVSISSDVIILTADHDINTPDMHGRNRKVEIEDFVWIGIRATILPGTKLDYGCIVAAGSVVTKNVLPFNIVAGIPAKIIGERKCKSGYTYSASYKRLFQ